MKNKEFIKLVNKYAILIFIGYALSFIITSIIQHFIPNPNNGGFDYITVLSSFTWIIQFIINIIAAIWISKDLKKFNIKNNLIVFMTVLFSLIGITMFFIMTNREMNKAVT